MRDADVRAAVKRSLVARHADDHETRIVEEMGIWAGAVRVDIAVINGELSGFELKSDSDTLQRLPHQADLYSRVFDRMCLVVGTRHTIKAMAVIPQWWGVLQATTGDGGTCVTEVRHSLANPAPDPYLVAHLLWKQEAVEALEVFGLARGWRSKPIKLLHERLAREVPFPELSARVRSVLKRRPEWLRKPVSN